MYLLLFFHNQKVQGFSELCVSLALYISDCFDRTELNDCDNKVKCLWVKMGGESQQGSHPAGGLLQTTQTG